MADMSADNHNPEELTPPDEVELEGYDHAIITEVNSTEADYPWMEQAKIQLFQERDWKLEFINGDSYIPSHIIYPMIEENARPRM